MPTTPWISAVAKVKDGTDVSAGVLNPILAQHTQRSQHLYEKFKDFSDKSVLIAYDQPVLPPASEIEPITVKKNSVVFYDKELRGSVYVEGLSPALVEFSSSTANSTAYTPANSAYTFGIVKNVNDSDMLADVYLFGLVEFADNMDGGDDPIIQSDEINPNETDASFQPGPFFLSRTEAGKITRSPGGVAIFIGYAVSRKKLMLSPDVSEFNQFFTAYRFNLLDRPCNKPFLDDDAWTLAGSSTVSKTRVGWVPATEDYVPEGITIPSGAKFFYNLPEASLITADTGITEAERDEQKDLAMVLPPNPINFTFLIVNGVVQSSVDLDAYGVYSLSAAGIWWHSDADGQQPWATNTTAREEVTFRGSNWVRFEDVAHTFEIGDTLKFETTTSLPAGLSTATTYYVIAVRSSGVVSGRQDEIQIATTSDGEAVTFTTTTTPDTFFVPQPYIWKFSKGSEEYRPKMLFQFVKFNPALTESIVTSLKKYNPASNALRFYKPNKTETSTGTGDLLARLVLTYTDAASAPSANAVSSLSFDETTGVTTVGKAPVVSTLIAGDGINIDQISVGGTPVPGNFIVSSTVRSQTGRLSYLEPDGAELIYEGLHSYLSLPYPTTLPSSIIGKIVLPSGVPIADMSLVLMLIGTQAIAGGSPASKVNFDFSYAVTKTGSALVSSTTPVSIDFDVPVPSTGYVAKTCFKVGPGLTASTYSIPLSSLSIPSTSFSGDSVINFKLTRTVPSSNAYAYPIGLVDLYWKIN